MGAAAVEPGGGGKGQRQGGARRPVWWPGPDAALEVLGAADWSDVHCGVDDLVVKASGKVGVVFHGSGQRGAVSTPHVEGALVEDGVFRVERQLDGDGSLVDRLGEAGVDAEGQA